MERCLRSVAGVVDELVVVDTGSVDATAEVARRHGARVVDMEWPDDFAAARNRSLELATGDWILVLDADEELHPEDRDRLRGLLAATDAEGILVQVLNYVGDPDRPDTELGVNLRIFRNRPEYRFAGALHEQIGESIARARPNPRLLDAGLRIRHYGYLQPEMERKGKLGRNLHLALREVERHPDDAFRRFNLGVEYARRGEFAAALPHLERAWQLAHPDALWTSKLAKNYLHSLIALGRWADALLLSQELIARYPRFTDLLFLRGLVLQQLGRKDEAEWAFRQCLALGPAPCPPYSGVEVLLGSARAHFALGCLYQEEERPAEAIAAFTAARQAAPAWSEPLYRLVQVSARWESLDQARARAEALVDARQAESLLLLADCFSVARCYELALAYADWGAGAPGPGTEAGVAYLRGHCLAKLGRFAEAVAALEQVSPDSPYHRRARITLAFCAVGQDLPEVARAHVAALDDPERACREVAHLFFDTALEVLEAAARRFPDSELLRDTSRQVRRYLAGGAGGGGG